MASIKKIKIGSTTYDIHATTADGYPVVTTLPSTVAWNTEYRLASGISTLSFTMPAITNMGEEVRVVFAASSDITAAISVPSGVTLYGAADLSITSGNRYELSISVIGPSQMGILCKEWAA